VLLHFITMGYMLSNGLCCITERSKVTNGKYLYFGERDDPFCIESLN